MRSLFSFFVVTAGLIVPAADVFALEAVAQQPYWQNGGKNLTANLKVDAVGNRVVRISETLTQFLVCNKAGQLFDGTNCVPPAAAGSPLSVSCPGGEVLTGIDKGQPQCASVAPGGVSLTLPTCADGEFMTVKGGTLACAPVTARKTYTEIVSGNFQWDAVNGTATRDIAIPAGATHFLADIFCFTLGTNGWVTMDYDFLPASGPLSRDRGCWNAGNNNGESTGFGYSKVLPIPAGATTLRVKFSGAGINLPGTAHSHAQTNYKFLKETLAP